MDQQSTNLPRKTLTGKLTLVFVFLGALLVATGYAVLYLGENALRNSALIFQEYKVEEEAERIDHYIDQTINDLKSFFILKDDIARDDFALTITHIYQLFLVNRGITDLTIISPAGMELLKVGRTGIVTREELIDVKDERYFQAAKEGRVLIGDIDQDNGLATHAYIVVPYFENFKLLGVIVGRVDFADLFSTMTLETSPFAGHLHIISRDGIMVGAQDSRILGASIADFELFKKLKSSGNLIGAECNVCFEKHDAPMLVAGQRVENDLGFFVVLESDKAKVLELYYSVRNIILGSLFVYLILAAAVVWQIRRRAQETIRAFIGGFENLHRGKFQEKILLKTGDDIEYLAENFNRVGAKLQKNFEEREVMLTRLQSVDAVKYNFIKTVSHQLRTPISVMLWTIENLVDQVAGALTKEQAAMFRDIYKGIMNINRVVNDMIIAVDIDEQKIVLEESETDFSELVDSAIKEIKSFADERGVTLTRKHPEEIEARGLSDAKKLRGVLVRLLENAIVYSEPHADKQVIVGMDTSDDMVLYYISDQGIGIPTSEQSLITDKFYRASNAYKLFQNSSGLGLYIANAFVELHGGQLWFDSQEGVGSNFYFSVPLKQDRKKNKK